MSCSSPLRTRPLIPRAALLRAFLCLALSSSTLAGLGRADAHATFAAVRAWFPQRIKSPKLAAVKAALDDQGLHEAMARTGDQIMLSRSSDYGSSMAIVLSARGIEHLSRNFVWNGGLPVRRPMRFSPASQWVTGGYVLHEDHIQMLPELLTAEIARIKAKPPRAATP